MIDAREHFYDEDPSLGHPDVRTRLGDVSYFFLGNGRITAAVQVCRGDMGTPVGLIVMNPEKPGKKRDSLTLDPESGLYETMIRITMKDTIHQAPGKKMSASWCFDSDYPMVSVTWVTQCFRVEERFLCMNTTGNQLVRKIRIRNIAPFRVDAVCGTGIPGSRLHCDLLLNPDEETEWHFVYELEPGGILKISQTQGKRINEDRKYWQSKAQISFHSNLPDRLFKVSAFQLPAVISDHSKVDASIWQYNREWVRDHSMMALGLILSGYHQKAGCLLERLLKEFVNPEGDTVDSSLSRAYDEVELDQNGELLYALEQYYCWTGDNRILHTNQDKIVALAEFPLKEVFRHPDSGLLTNTRGFWERHRLHGIRPGMELTSQLFTVIGLSSASNLAGLLGWENKKTRWKAEAERIRNDMLADNGFGLIHQGKLIKRRDDNGSVRYSIQPLPEAHLPALVPLAKPGDHLLNPDTATALPIAYGLIPGNSSIAYATMSELEHLWNQDWDTGGYGRYHISSEPDSPGAWPFPSLFIARAYMEMKQYDNVWRVLNWLYNLPGGEAGTWFENYGERVSPPFPQVGIPPWTWAEMILLFVHHIVGIRPGMDHIRIKPGLLPGMERIEASFPFRGHTLSVKVNKKKVTVPEFKTNGTIIETDNEGVIIKNKDCDLYIEAFIP